MNHNSEPQLVRNLLALGQLGKKANALDRCKSLGEAKATYVALYPETNHGGLRVKGQSRNGTAPSFVDFVAQLTGYSPRAITISVKIWKGLTLESREMVAGMAIASKQCHLDLLSRASPDQQRRALEFLQSGGARRVQDSLVQAVNN